MVIFVIFVYRLIQIFIYCIIHKVGHTGVLPEDGWFISTVIVTVPTSGTQYYFTCRRWISRDRGDCKLEVDLIPTNVNKQVLHAKQSNICW